MLLYLKNLIECGRDRSLIQGTEIHPAKDAPGQIDSFEKKKSPVRSFRN